MKNILFFSIFMVFFFAVNVHMNFEGKDTYKVITGEHQVQDYFLDGGEGNYMNCYDSKCDIQTLVFYTEDDDRQDEIVQLDIQAPFGRNFR